MTVEISVVIPAFNEAERLGSTLEQVTRYLVGRGLDYEVIVVDDGSRDATVSVARSFEQHAVRTLSLPENRGKGCALRHGVLHSRGRRVLLTDADLSTPIKDLEALEGHLDVADLVLGSRAVGDSRVTIHQPFYRESMGKIFNLLVRLLGITRLRDTQCGFKLLDGDVARQLFAHLRVDGFAYDVELVLLAQRQHYRLVEVGVEWANSASSRVRPVVHSLGMVWDVLRVRFRHLAD